MNRTLATFRADVTERVISEGIAADASKVEVRPMPGALPIPAENIAGRSIVPERLQANRKFAGVFRLKQ